MKKSDCLEAKQRNEGLLKTSAQLCTAQEPGVARHASLVASSRGGDLCGSITFSRGGRSGQHFRLSDVFLEVLPNTSAGGLILPSYAS